MKAFYFRFLLFFALILTGSFALAQHPNDECSTARLIKNPKNFCDTISTTGATAGTLSSPSCFSSNGRDIWLSFRAIATDMRMSISNVNGASTPNPQGALYSTEDCQSFNELICRSGTNGQVELYRGGLIPGETYYIRLQTSTGNSFFRYCITNYNPPADPSSDCPKGSVLCDKSSFSIKSVTGAGSNTREMEDAACFFTDGISSTPQTSTIETNSTWFRWTAATTGSLAFTLTPLVISDDIDFIVYELPNGIDDCAGKKVLRCMASGDETQPNANPDARNRRCWGATGLSLTANDDSEPVGCRNGVPHDNYVRALDMVAGKSYALAINNYTSNGNGFNVEFGGSGEFLGPQAKIGIDRPDKKYCLGETVTFTDNSSFALGQITKRQWRFGKNASIDTANGVGPFRVFYKTPGWKSVVLTITTDRGCIVTSILDSIFVKPFQYDSLLRRPTCTQGTDGMIRLKVVECGRAPIRYNWENTGYTTRDSISGLSPGRYRVAVTDSSGLYIDTLVFNLKQFEVELDTAKRIITPPQCFGFSNGRIVLNPKTGVAPFRYKWNNNPNFTADNFLNAIGEGQYTVEIRDNNNCKGVYSFDVIAPSQVAVAVDTFNISCFGLTDGQAVAYPSGGVGGYSVSWSRGDVGDTVRNLRAGQYSVFVRDSNNCEIRSGVLISEPPQIGLNTLRVQPAKCYGDSTAELVIAGKGGTPPYRFSIDGVRFQKDSAFLKIPAKKYSVVVRDSTGCRSTIEVNVPQPPQLQVSVGPDLEVDLGFSENLRATVVPSTKLVSYTWTPKDTTMSCSTCAQTTVFPLRNTLYGVTIKDSAGCTAFDELLLSVIKKRPIYIPNVFSPTDHNGVNDFFTIYGNQSAVVIKELKIFNRWGDLMFQASNIPLNKDEVGWDGTWRSQRLQPDVFAFFAIIKFIDGEEVIYKGDVTIVR